MVLSLVPLAFALVGYLILFFSAKSAINSVVDIWSMMATDTQVYDTDDTYTDLYSGEIFHSYTDTVPSSIITFPVPGTKYGEITIEGTSVDCPLFFGDDSKTLRRGVGQYKGSSFPGMCSTTIIGGHNNSFFKTLKDAKVGGIITIKTHYGVYTYKITGSAIKKFDDRTAFDINTDHENVVLYTCYPFNALGLTKQRYFVYGEYISGPKILLDE